MTSAVWRRGPERLEPPAGVDVWRCTLARQGALFEALQRLLDAGERRRAARFLFPEHAARFTAARGLLRLVLSRYLGRTPASLAFDYGEHGKPDLRDPGAPPLSFNLSHSGDLLVIAVASRRQVGVDVERERPQDGHDLDTVVEQFFSPAERRALAELDPARRQRAFFACWTRKEAFVKALGRGLSLPLDAFDVSVDPDGPARLVAHRLPEAQESSWSLHALPAGPGFSATLAVGPALAPPLNEIRLWYG